jgi:hypothetical protein
VWTRYSFNVTPNASTACVSIPFGSDPAIDCGGRGRGRVHHLYAPARYISFTVFLHKKHKEGCLNESTADG